MIYWGLCATDQCLHINLGVQSKIVWVCATLKIYFILWGLFSNLFFRKKENTGATWWPTGAILVALGANSI